MGRRKNAPCLYPCQRTITLYKIRISSQSSISKALSGTFFVDREKVEKGGFSPDLAKVSKGSSLSLSRIQLPYCITIKYSFRMIDLSRVGGTGSLLLARLVRIDYALRPIEHPRLHVIAYDSVRVKPNKVCRQLYILSDIGEHQAVNAVR